MNNAYILTREITITQEIEIEGVDSEEAAILQSENARDAEWFEVQVNHVEITDVECCENN